MVHEEPVGHVVQPRTETNFTWILQSQSEKARAFLISKDLWPLPEVWEPKMDFEHALMPNGSGGPNFNATLPQTLWISCAEQYEECACYGKIRWGIEGRWIYIPPSSGFATNRIMCQIGKQKDVPELIDVSPGDASKHCECQVPRKFRVLFGQFVFLNVWLLVWVTAK